MVSKYVRELAMELFNRFWQTHLPTPKPTHGYPRDAHRFRREVAEVQSRLAFPDDLLWRERDACPTELSKPLLTKKSSRWHTPGPVKSADERRLRFGNERLSVLR
jgi:hypothetical protein